jgi:hypothetical protein
MNWLTVLLKSATSRGAGVHPDTWRAVATRSELPVPPDVRKLYELTDGARFSGEVTLWTWKEVEEHTSRGLGTLKPNEVWLLGTKRETGIFFAARSRPLLRALPAAARTNWLRSVEADGMVYGLWRAADDVLVVRSLQELLQMSVARPGEDFGEVTYVRAMHAVKNALAELEPSKTKPPKPSRPSAPPARKAAKSPARKKP